MSTKKQIIDYVTHTPENVNSNVLSSMLDSLSGGASSWADLTGKPFDSVGNGLKVEDKNLKLDESFIPTFTAGENISIEDGVISAVDTKYTAGENISIDENNVISATGGSSGADWDAEEDQAGFIKNKPFDVPYEEDKQIVKSTADYNKSSECFEKIETAQFDHTITDEDLGKEITFIVGEKKFKGTLVKDISTGIREAYYVYYNWDREEATPIERPAFAAMFDYNEELTSDVIVLVYCPEEEYEEGEEIEFSFTYHEEGLTKLPIEKTNVSWNNLPDKPFGNKIEETILEGLTIEWDEESSSYVYMEEEPKKYWFTDSDIGKTATLIYDGEEYTGKISRIDGVPSLFINLDTNYNPTGYPCFGILSVNIENNHFNAAMVSINESGEPVGDTVTIDKILIEETSKLSRDLIEGGSGEVFYLRATSDDLLSGKLEIISTYEEVVEALDNGANIIFNLNDMFYAPLVMILNDGENISLEFQGRFFIALFELDWNIIVAYHDGESDYSIVSHSGSSSLTTDLDSMYGIQAVTTEVNTTGKWTKTEFYSADVYDLEKEEDVWKYEGDTYFECSDSRFSEASICRTKNNHLIESSTKNISKVEKDEKTYYIISEGYYDPDTFKPTENDKCIFIIENTQPGRGIFTFYYKGEERPEYQYECVFTEKTPNKLIADNIKVDNSTIGVNENHELCVLSSKVPDYPTEDGEYVLKVENGEATWILKQ